VEFAEQGPSDDWAPLDHLLEDIADAWFRPGDQGPTFLFRVPRDRIPPAAAGEPLTIERLMVAAAISKDEVESWRLEGTSVSEMGEPLPAPPPGETHLTVVVRMKPPAPPGEVSPETWQDLDALWKSIQVLESTIDSLRLSMDGLRIEMEAAFKKSLTVEEKVHALQADVAQWNRAKNLGRYAVPKVREFIHRATWAAATPERKRITDLIENHLKPRVPLPRMDEVRDQLGHFQKDRQVLLAQGNAVNQEGRGILAEIQRHLAALQRNAADRARQKRSAGRDKGKHL
jgi:hypothetical protein